MKNIDELVDQIKEKSNRLRGRSFFYKGSSKPEVALFEMIMKVRLPDVLKTFYFNFNGGFFADLSMTDKQIDKIITVAEIESNSNSFSSLQDIIQWYSYDTESFIDFKSEEARTGKRLIPVFVTKNYCHYVWDATDNSQTPILFAHEEDNNPIEWKLVYHSFEEFLAEYINKEGNI